MPSTVRGNVIKLRSVRLVYAKNSKTDAVGRSGALLRPAECTVFTEICGKSATSSRADRVVGTYNGLCSLLSGRTTPPAGCTGFTGIFGEFAAAPRADVGIGPYKRPHQGQRHINPNIFLTRKSRRSAMQSGGLLI